ncbi:hypothetical protein A2U01_0075044, partial [Trifolium medium]|nr:hypothetical protein [Trifolium medium]
MGLDEVIWFPRRCSQCGMVEQATILTGSHYDDWIIIGASHVGMKVDVARQG